MDNPTETPLYLIGREEDDQWARLSCGQCVAPRPTKKETDSGIRFFFYSSVNVTKRP